MANPALPNWSSLTRNNQRSALEGIFEATDTAHEDIRRSILNGLSTRDFHALRSTCRSIDHSLMTPAGTGPRRLRYDVDLIDKCHEQGLPIPPSLAPGGTCPNSPQTRHEVKQCEYAEYPDLRQWHPHDRLTQRRRRQILSREERAIRRRHGLIPPDEQLVCRDCRHNWHHNIGTNPEAPRPNPKSRHDFWRADILARAHLTVCRLCDAEQKASHPPEGFDGCRCYRNYYSSRWLCQRCDVRNSWLVSGAIAHKLVHIRHLRRVGNDMQVMPGPEPPPLTGEPWCPCGRRKRLLPGPPAMQNLLTPFPGNHHMIGVSRAPANKRITKQCIMCCGFVVPPSGPTAGKPRRSARIRDKKFGRQDSYRHEMLGGSKTKTNFDLNKHGFEIRGRGGWV